MLNIYVLEDHFIQQNRIEEVIHTILKKNNIKVGDFEVFDKPNQLLDFYYRARVSSALFPRHSD